MENTEKTSEDATGYEKDKKMTVGRYLGTRLSTLKPPMNKPPGPFKSLAKLNTQKWLFFLVRVLSLGVLHPETEPVLTHVRWHSWLGLGTPSTSSRSP